MIDLVYGDCMDYMKDLEDNAFDLAPVDPEWGINASKPTKKPFSVKQRNVKIIKVSKPSYNTNKEWDNNPASSEYGKELFRVSKNQIIWGANFFDWIVPTTFKPPRREDFGQFIKEHPAGWIIWDKINGNSDQWDCEIAWTSFDQPTTIYKYMWSGMMQGSKANGAIMEGNKKLNEKRIHPTQKPIQLYKWTLLNYAQPGDKILDTHLGSASSAIADDELGIDFTGCEIDKEIYTSAVKRFNNYKSQLKLKL